MNEVKFFEFKYLPIKNVTTSSKYRAVHGFFVEAARGKRGSGSILTFDESKVTVGTLINQIETTKRPT